MTLSSARTLERRRRVVAFAGAIAMSAAGIACGSAAGYAASHAHRVAVRAQFGFDIHSAADWKRLEFQWRAGRFSMNSPRRMVFAASVVGGGAACAAIALLAAFRIPRLAVGGIKSARARWRDRSRVPAAVPASVDAARPASAPAQAASAPAAAPPATGEPAGATPSIDDVVRNLETTPGAEEAAAELRRLKEAAQRAVEEAHADVRDNAEREVGAAADLAARAGVDDAPAPPAPVDAAQTGRERDLAVARVRRDAADVEAHILDGEGFGCDIAVVAGRTIVLATMFVDDGDWRAVDSASEAIWHSERGTIESPAYAAALVAREVREKLGDRLQNFDMTLRAALCLGGRASLLSIGLDCRWGDYEIDVVDASADESAGAGIDSVASLLRGFAMDRTPPEAIVALQAYADLNRKVAA